MASSVSSSRFEALTGLRPARFAHDREGPSLARALLVVSLVRFAVISVGLGIAILRHLSSADPEAPEVDGWVYIAFGLGYLSCLVGTLALRLGRYLRPVAYALVLFDSAFVTFTVAFTGGGESVYAFVYVLVVLEGGILLLRPGGWAALLACTVGYALVLLAKAAGGVDGSATPVSGAIINGFLVQVAGTGLVAVLASELSTRLRVADQRLAEREDELARLGALHAAILEALPAGVLTVGADGRVRYGNDAARTLLRRGGEPLVGLTLAQLMDPIADALEQEPVAPRTRARREAEVRLVDGSMARFGYSLARFRQADDAWSVVVVFQDVTEFVRLEEAARRAERLAMVGRFAAGLAHEVRNPLASMCASVDVLQQSVSLTGPMERLMGNVVGEAHRLEALIRDFLNFARPQKLSFSSVRLWDVVEGVLVLFRNDPVATEVEVRLEGDPEVVATADADLFRQVLWNVLRNGAEASGPGGHLVLGLGRSDGMAELRVLDDGPGFAAENLGRALDPFFTTKRKGSGLGLAISQSILHAHGGELELGNRAGGGAEVRLLLPMGLPTMDLELGSLTPSENLRIVPSTGEA